MIRIDWEAYGRQRKIEAMSRSSFLKGMAVAVVLVLNGCVLLPFVQAQASTNQGFEEVTVEAVGAPGFEKQTIRMTSEQYQEFQQRIAL